MTTIATFSPTNPVATNPFATRFTSPGRLPPLDASGIALDLEELLGRLRHLGDRAAIRGPHGTGKSTLLASMAERLRRDGRLGGHARLGLGWLRDLVAVAAGLAACGRGRVLCIDSWERLGGVAAAIACGVARATGRGLLVTSHGEGPLPTLLTCSATPRLLCRIVDLLPDRHGLLSPADIEETFHHAGGNLREALFLLYDRFEQARSRLVRS